MICTLWTPFQAERDCKKFIPRDSLNSSLIDILFSMNLIDNEKLTFQWFSLKKMSEVFTFYVIYVI